MSMQHPELAHRQNELFGSGFDAEIALTVLRQLDDGVGAAAFLRSVGADNILSVSGKAARREPSRSIC
jgi:hypothetical protein